MVFLFIDDNATWLHVLSSLSYFVGGNSQVFFVECHDVKSALGAIARYKPDVIFLDHSLSDGGEEGFQIVAQVKVAKIYSTSADFGVAIQYKELGVEYVGKTNLKRIRAIISEAPAVG